jgi:UDP-3-O-[3-hydroxymyristoyl] glucosamine N-acyltransferase
MKLTVAELAQRINAELFGEGLAHVTGVGAVETCGEHEVTFVSDDRYTSKLEECGAGAVIVPHRIDSLSRPQLIVGDVNSALVKVLETFAPKMKDQMDGIDPAAKIGQNVDIAEGVRIGPDVVIEDDVEIGQNTTISSGARIAQNSKIGKDCQIHFNVVIYHHCTIGNNVIIQANSTIGATGFGYHLVDGEPRLIPHIGGVVIEDGVEIGANCCVDRAKFANTIIGAGTKIDNLVQIAHNVRIGRCCLIAGMVGISGSCTLGDGVVLAGQVGLVDHIEAGDHAMVGVKSLVHHNIRAGQHVFGSPTTEKNEALKTIGLTKRLPKLQERIEKLERQLSEHIDGPCGKSWRKQKGRH